MSNARIAPSLPAFTHWVCTNRRVHSKMISKYNWSLFFFRSFFSITNIKLLIISNEVRTSHSLPSFIFIPINSVNSKSLTINIQIKRWIVLFKTQLPSKHVVCVFLMLESCKFLPKYGWWLWFSSWVNSLLHFFVVNVQCSSRSPCYIIHTSHLHIM